MSCKDCENKGTVYLVGDYSLCHSCFSKRCYGLEGKPSMSAVFGPAILTVTFDPDRGQVVPDNQVRGIVKCTIRDFIEMRGDHSHSVGSEIIINAYRLAVLRGDIEPFHIMFNFGGELYNINEHGNIQYSSNDQVPRSENVSIIEDLLTGAIRQRKEKRK